MKKRENQFKIRIRCITVQIKSLPKGIQTLIDCELPNSFHGNTFFILVLYKICNLVSKNSYLNK